MTEELKDAELVAWRWEVEVLGVKTWQYASHWSTGPKDAQPLYAAPQPVQTQLALTDEQRNLIKAAAECIAESVTFEQDGFDTPPMPATQWDYNADQLAYALRAMLEDGAKP